MNDIDEKFNIYSISWCKKNKLPKECLVKGKYWQQAWSDFMTDVLLPNYESIKQSFLDIRTITIQEMQTPVVTQESENITSNWEEVQKYLN